MIRNRSQSRIRIRIHTCDKWIQMRILEAHKHVDPVDPDDESDPDPQHWCLVPLLPFTCEIVLLPSLSLYGTACKFNSPNFVL